MFEFIKTASPFAGLLRFCETKSRNDEFGEFKNLNIGDCFDFSAKNLAMTMEANFFNLSLRVSKANEAIAKA